MAIRLHGTAGSWTLPEGETVMGRAEGCAIRISDRRLSRRHASFQVEGGVAMVMDLGSANPVLVNGDRVVQRMLLRHGDAVVVGPLLLRVEVTEAAAPPRISTTMATVDAAAPPAPPAPPPRGATQAMDPAEVATLAEESRHAKAVDPHIVAALGRPASPRAAHPTTSYHLGSTAHRPATAPTELGALDAAVTRVAPGEGSLPGTGFVAPEAPPATSALTASPHRRPWFRPLVLRRVVAVVLDVLSLLLIGVVVGLVPLAGGLAQAAVMVGAGVHDGRVVIMPGVAPATWMDVGMALLLPVGLADVPHLLHQLLHEARSFPGVFLGLSTAAITLELTLLFGTVSATVRHGAPWWHRQCGLELVVRRQNHRPGWVRALVRWTLAGVLAPVTMVTIWWGGRSWHDRLTGMEVRERST